ncbi:MAG: TRAP transporter large permease [Lachnospiraceae bacterium]|jgi:tripartite ATP-independent transporter DctM subunit|nr:TRAP transporter large permease [Lachnospiraceae bacterium]MCI9623457.1 TRAP transporter large permease [Lachnospiraceae bacterium]
MSVAFWVYLIIFIAFLACGAPIYMALLSSGLSYCFLHGGIDNMAVMAKMYGSLDSFVLLAIPMFMAAGIVMNNGGITDRIFNVCRALLGHLPGGLAYVNVLASFLFSGMSGSALADVGGLGNVEIKAMRDEGYDDDTIFGITAASATMGPIVPPSIPMVVYGSAASVSVGTLFVAGLGPGIAIGIILCIAVFLVSKRHKYQVHKRATLRELLGCIKRSFFALLLPIIIMGGIMCGYFTPTEASCIAITYCIFVVCLVYRDMPFRHLLGVVDGTVSGIVPALAIVSSASLFGWVLQFEHLGQKMYTGIMAVTDNKWLILLIIDLILLFFGMILDSTPTIMLLVPIFQPLTQAVGISSIHLGIIVVLNLMIGLMTPPYGQSLFMLSGTTGVSFNKIVKYVMPWLLPMFIALLAVTFIEPITLAIPVMLGFEVF